VDAYTSERGTYFTGLQTCGHITCPVCGPSIRQKERQRLQRLIADHIDAGGFVYLFLLTISHGRRDRLGDLLDALDAGRSAAIGGKGGSRWAKDRRDFGIEGTSWHREVLYGANGWHPHQHGLLFTSRELTDAEIGQLQQRMYGRHQAALEEAGFRALSAFNGIERVHSPEAIGAYLTKEDDAAGTARRLAAEMTRGDMKTGKGMSPGAILDRFAETGDVADLNLFRDYERGSEGRRWRYIASNLAKRYAIDAKDEEGTGEGQDQEDAQESVGGTLAIRIPLHAWKVITRRLGAVSELRRLIHAGNMEMALQLVWRAQHEAERRPPDREKVGRLFERGRARSPG